MSRSINIRLIESILIPRSTCELSNNNNNNNSNDNDKNSNSRQERRNVTRLSGDGLKVYNNLEKRRLWKHRFLVLFVTFLVYSVYHMSRKPMSVVKSELYNKSRPNSENWEPFNDNTANNKLSILDGAYWGTYAIGMFAAGYLAERSDIRIFLTISMSLCGTLCIASGLAFFLKIHSFWYFLITQILTGLVEATGWPSVLAVIGVWFGSAKKGFIFGCWSLHTSFGNILGSAIAGAFVDHQWGLSFIVPGIICIIFGIIVYFVLIPKPSDVDLKVEMAFPKEDDEETETSEIVEDDIENGIPHKIENSTSEKSRDSNVTDDEEEEAISLWSAIKLPGVIEFSVCLFFTKSVSYIFLNWLPKFISSQTDLSPSEAAYVSIMFDIGGSVGSILAGLLADYTNSGATICMAFLLLSIPSLFLLLKFLSVNLAVNLILQFLNGFLINGPYSLITTAVSANLACQVPSKAATATVSAIIDGTGSIGAAIGPAVTGPLSNLGWDAVFYLCMIGELIAALCLTRVGYSEMKRKFRKNV